MIGQRKVVILVRQWSTNPNLITREQSNALRTLASYGHLIFEAKFALSLGKKALTFSLNPPDTDTPLKGLCHGSPVHFVIFANYSPSIAIELKVSKEITCKWQSQRFGRNKYVSWALFLKLQTAEINFQKLWSWTVFKNPNFNPFQSSSVLPIRDICCICQVILPSFNV